MTIGIALDLLKSSKNAYGKILLRKVFLFLFCPTLLSETNGFSNLDLNFYSCFQFKALYVYNPAKKVNNHTI